ncbi:MAG TPA: M3 family oligoendopeptidase [Tepidisphaeraceae bacterium]|nr:M3 family oligoendopeptidase [Tepidisphaeraceae bacterium]
MTVATPPKRNFVPANLNVAEWPEVQPLYQALLDRSIGSVQDLEKWLADLSELACVVDEFGVRRSIDKSCHTDDPETQARFLFFVEQIDPKTKPLMFELQKKYLVLPYRSGLTDRKFRILDRQWQADVDLFREANVPLQTEDIKLVNEYDKLFAAMIINFRGQDYTPQQMAKFLEEPDRATRQESWELTAKRRLQDREVIDQLFDRLLPLRQQIANNAGLADYRAYKWKEYKRFDYTPDDCAEFAISVARYVVPLVDKLDRERAKDLGVDRLRPWDLAVDPKSRPMLKPFDPEKIDDFVSRTKEIFDRISPQLAADFETLRTNKNLDLGSRKGKQPGGYQATLEEVRQPFIFMNAAGIHRDVVILLHEGGHAFHTMLTTEPLAFLRNAPIEFCEVASMSMEMFANEHLDVFYSPADAVRAKQWHLEGVIRILPWIAMVDSFQSWLYTHPCHSRQEREKHWLDLDEQFMSKLDWSGYDDVRRLLWHRQLHLFHVPFYYIEYGIAQLGALQLWMKSKSDPRAALSNYRAGLKLGGTRPLPELFAAAGIQFDFSEKTLRPLMNAVSEELNELDDEL